ncbi:MAG: hypothetical protein Q4B80_04495 [Aerococcaceae bacterium]|nr:hypothetical protein [Aerococcaceae bacterium]
MDVDEIITRLGLKDKKELGDLLDFSNRAKMINEFVNSIYYKGEFLCSEEKCRTVTIINEGKEAGAVSKSTHSNSSKGKKRGWCCVFKAKNKREIERKHIGNPKQFPVGNIPKGEDCEWYFHRGHILAHSLCKFLTEQHIIKKFRNKPDEKWTDNKINCKETNVFTQFNVANKDQAIIENKISEYLSTGKGVVFYDVKLIYRDNSDVYPIGTEIFYKILISNEEQSGGILENEGHYFIPNCDIGFKLECQEAYQRFYREGCRDRYREKFNNSDRGKNNFQVTEDTSESVFYMFFNPDRKKYKYSNKEYVPEIHTVITGDEDIDFSEYKIIKFENNLDKSIASGKNCIIFSDSQIDSIDQFLKTNKLVEESKSKKFYYYVGKSHHSGIYGAYGENENTTAKHESFTHLKDAINKLSTNAY